MTEDEYTEFIAEQRRKARQRLDDLLYDLRCTIWPRYALSHMAVIRPQNAFRIIVGTTA